MTDIAIYGPLKQTETGPSAVTRGIVDGLADIGHDVTLYTAGDDEHSRAHTVAIPGSLDSVPNYFRTKRRAAKLIEANDHELFHSLTGLMHGSDVQTVQGIFADLQMIMWSPQIINPRESSPWAYTTLSGGHPKTERVITYLSPDLSRLSRELTEFYNIWIRKTTDLLLTFVVAFKIRHM